MACLEMIYAVNVNPYHLHYAAISEKKGNFFDSPFVISTSNYNKTTREYLPSNLGIVDFYALYRRMQIKVLMHRKESDVEYDDVYDQSQATYSFDIIRDDGKLGSNIDLAQLLKMIREQYLHNVADFNRFTSCTDEEVLGKVRTSAVMGGIVREKSEGLQPVNTDKKPMPPKPPVAKPKPSFNYKPPVKTWRTTEPGEEILPPGSLLSAMAEEGNKIVRKHLENPDAQCELCWTIKHNVLC
jgi:hypothetical protein